MRSAGFRWPSTGAAARDHRARAEKCRRQCPTRPRAARNAARRPAARRCGCGGRCSALSALARRGAELADRIPFGPSNVLVSREAAPVTDPASELVTVLSGVGRARADEAAPWAPLTVPTASPGVDGPGNGMVKVGDGSPRPPRSVTPRPTPPRSTPQPVAKTCAAKARPAEARSAKTCAAKTCAAETRSASTRSTEARPADPGRSRRRAADPIPPTAPPTLGTPPPRPRSCAPAPVEPRQCNATAGSAMPMVRITLMELGKWPPPGGNDDAIPRADQPNQRQDFDRFMSGLGWREPGGKP